MLRLRGSGGWNGMGGAAGKRSKDRQQQENAEPTTQTVHHCRLEVILRTSALSGKFTPLLRASFRRQLCCATSKYSRHCCVARLTGDENPSRINNTNFPDSTLATCKRLLNKAAGTRQYIQSPLDLTVDV